jgi:hypothetical protein
LSRRTVTIIPELQAPFAELEARLQLEASFQAAYGNARAATAAARLSVEQAMGKLYAANAGLDWVVLDGVAYRVNRDTAKLERIELAFAREESPR